MTQQIVKQALIWIDLETTGLDRFRDVILEIACIITDKALNVVAEMPTLVVHRSQEVLDNMDEWCRKTHGETGLIKESLKSKLTIQDADRQVYDFIRQYVSKRNVGILAGSSIHFDRAYMAREMPITESHLNHRMVDVSSIGELVKRWYPPNVRLNRPPTLGTHHRALDDIRTSIQELRYYKKNVFVKSNHEDANADYGNKD